MMARYFDAFLYLANWGSPASNVPAPADRARHRSRRAVLLHRRRSLIRTGDHLIISLFADRDPDDFWDETAGDLGGMVAARSSFSPAITACCTSRG